MPGFPLHLKENLRQLQDNLKFEQLKLQVKLLKERWFRQRPIIDLWRKAGIEEEEIIKDTVKKKRYRRTRSEWYYRRQRRSINCTQSFSYQVLMDTSFRLFFRSE